VNKPTRWFMSYVQVYRDGRFQFGSTTVDHNGEHPVATVLRWNESYGKKDGFQMVLLSFQPVGDDCPEMDILSHGIS
jgi:hypothetical protein